MSQTRFPALLSLSIAFVSFTPQNSEAAAVRVEGDVSCEGFPQGTEELANHRNRFECWEGPPVGGLFNSYYRGGTDDFNEFLNAYSRIDSPSIELIVVDWGRDKYDSLVKKPYDWTLSIGSYNLPKNQERSVQYLKSVGPLTAFIGEGGSIVWADVQLPAGLRVLDLRKSSITDKRDREILDKIESVGCEVFIYAQHRNILLEVRHPKRGEPLYVSAPDISTALREIEAKLGTLVEPDTFPKQ